METVDPQVVKSVLRGLEDPLAPLARIEVRLRELQGEEVGLLDMGTVAEARAMAAAGALADATATAGASASATVTLRTGAQRKPSFADLYRKCREHSLRTVAAAYSQFKHAWPAGLCSELSPTQSLWFRNALGNTSVRHRN